MSNMCKYKVRVKGKKNACYAFLGSMSYRDYREIDKEEGKESDYTLWFSGDCKEDVNDSCQPWDGEMPEELAIEGTCKVETRKGEESDLDDLLSKLESMLKFLENPNE